MLEEKLAKNPLFGKVGIGHTRWATHGKPSDENAHPHRSGPFVVVHNGIIENYADIKAELQREGIEFSSETDTEVIVKLAEREWRSGKEPRQAIIATLKQLRGELRRRLPPTKKTLQNSSPPARKAPLIMGIAEDGHYLASDVPRHPPLHPKDRLPGGRRHRQPQPEHLLH